jgi:hypothetical protein
MVDPAIPHLLRAQATQLQIVSEMLERHEWLQGVATPVEEDMNPSETETQGEEERPRGDSHAAAWVERTAKLAAVLGRYPETVEKLAAWADTLPDPEAPAELATKYLLPDGSLTNSASVALGAWMHGHPERARAEEVNMARIERRAQDMRRAAPSKDEAALAKADEAASALAD